MSERVGVHVKVDRDVWEAFQSFVIETHGQKYGNLGREAENALSEYMDRDRLARVEERLDAIEGHLSNPDSAHAHTKSEAAVKVERIADRLADTGRRVIPNDEVLRAIESIAGADDRTVRKYRTQLKRQGMAYEHPSGGDAPVWTLDRQQWVDWAETQLNNDPTEDIHDLLEPYPMTYDGYDHLATEVVEA